MRKILAVGLVAIGACTGGTVPPPTPTGQFVQQLGTCGDGTLDLDEQCDDTNTTDGDGCSSTCRLEPGFSCRPGHKCDPTLCEAAYTLDGSGAPTPSVVLRGNYIEIGLNHDAAFGTSGYDGTGAAPPTGWHPRSANDFGFVSDPDASAWTAYHGDFFTPGSPEEGWGMQMTDTDGTTYYAGNNRTGPSGDESITVEAIPGAFDAPVCHTEGLCRKRGGATVAWNATAPWHGLQVAHTYTIVDGGVFIVVDVDVTNTTGSDLANIYYLRNVDPDNDQSLTGNYTTTNTIVSQPDPVAGTTIALVTGAQDAVVDKTTASALSLIANDARARVSTGGFDVRSPQAVYEGAGDGNATPVGTGTYYQDVAISVAFKFDLAAGEHTHLRYAYNLEADPIQALQCSVPCGDGALDLEEQCDDGNQVDGDGCSAQCTIEPHYTCDQQPSVCTPICGDGLLTGPEPCDDMNTTDGDGCSSTCQVETGWTCADAPSTCAPICGDGIHAGDETCDDGNATDGDGCSSTCQIEPGWTCAVASAKRPSINAADTCTAICGDGLVVGSEGCDDHNTTPDDGCSATCTIEPGYSCAGAPSTCTPNCGDGTVDGSEACDDGNATSGDGCSAACAIEPGYQCPDTGGACHTVCGDGIRAGAEACDDGNTASGDGCTSTCTVESGYSCAGKTPDHCTTSCGDGVLAGAEACDDGNTTDGDGCSASCEIEDKDGDGIVDTHDDCPTVVNPNQVDTDHDGLGDECDSDADGNGIDDSLDVSGGGGCSTGGGAGGGSTALALILAGLVVVRRRRALALGVVAMSAGTAAADTGFSVERFRLAVDRDGVIDVESGGVQNHMAIDADLWFGYANNPLILVDKSGTRQGALVTTRMASNLSAAISLADRFELGADIPIILDQSSENASASDPMLPGVTAGGFGDIRFVPKIQLLKQHETLLDLAIIPSFTVPSGGGKDYKGEATVSFAPEAAASKTIGDMRIAANLGYRMRKEQMLQNLVIDDEVFGQGGVAYKASPIEVSGALAFATAAAHPFAHAGNTYAELLGAVSINVTQMIGASIIGGVGLDHGYGTPDWRLVLAARMTLDSFVKKPAGSSDPPVTFGD